MAKEVWLSASSISDFWDCPRRYFYRIFRSDAAIKSEHLILGGIIHQGIEKLESGEIGDDKVIDWALDEWYSRTKFLAKHWKSPHPPKKVDKLLGNYMSHIRPRLQFDPPPLIEHSFKLPVIDNVYLVGKMDRIEEGVFYDWKTAGKPPGRYELQDMQFILYWWAYKQLYGHDPTAIYYGYLMGGKCYNVIMNEILLSDTEKLLDKTAKIVYNMRNKDTKEEISSGFSRRSGWHCNRCMYRGICDRELNVTIS